MVKDQDILIIGIDGGATKITALPMHITGTGSLQSDDPEKTALYRNHPLFKTDFTPVDLKTQLSEMKAGNLNLSPLELSQSTAILETIAKVISKVYFQHGKKKLLVGIGFPGIKTSDKKGIAAIANGPRIPSFLYDLERQLTVQGVSLKAPLGALGSDADFCGIGEEYAPNGKFREVKNAYYLGGGTGVADAMKLNGNLITFDSSRSWIAKTWEFATPDGQSFERFISANGIQFQYGKLSGIDQEELTTKGIYLDQILELGLKGDSAAHRTIDSVIKTTCNLLYERISTLYSGYNGKMQFIDKHKETPDTNHPFLGTLLERILFGQRSAVFYKRLLEMEKYRSTFLEQLGSLLLKDGSINELAKRHYLNGLQFNVSLIDFSDLRNAPAIGAGIDSYNNYIHALHDEN